MGHDRGALRSSVDEGPGPAAIGLVALLLLTVPLAGCADDGSPSGGDSPAEGEAFTARDGIDQARSVADGWSSSAELAGITMIEQAEEPEQWPDEAFAYQGDGEVGDGYIGQWLYFFIDGDQQLGVYVNADGETHTDEDPPGQTPSQPLGDWSVDSNETAETAKDNDTFSEIVSAEDASVLYALQEGQQGTVWFASAKSESMDANQSVVVDAQTGEGQAFGR